jgi:hypothetical protein
MKFEAAETLLRIAHKYNFLLVNTNGKKQTEEVQKEVVQEFSRSGNTENIEAIKIARFIEQYSRKPSELHSQKLNDIASGRGINTVEIDGEVIHVTDLEPDILCEQWSKRQRELNELYITNSDLNNSWKGWVLKLFGINLPDKKGIWLMGVDSKNNSLYQHKSTIGKTSDGLSD